jgi:3-hydroxyisobutyrate dehydrogenase
MAGANSVGFIGLGAMGGPMAASLLKKGFGVRGCDVAKPALEALDKAGGTAVATPAAAAEGTGLLFLMVATPAQVEAVLDGQDGALATLPQGATVVMNATVPPAFARRLGERLAEGGWLLLDAPVSGGQVGAVNGTLTIMASGPAAAFEAAEGALAAVAGRVYRFGEVPGMGSTMKMINQHLAGVHIVAAAEGLALAARAGLDPKAAFDVVTNSAARSWMLENRGPHMLERDFTPLSAVDIFVKDLGIVLDAARDLRFPLPMAAAAHQQFLAAAGGGLGREDDAAVVKVYEKLVGIEVKGGEVKGGKG